MAAPKRWLLAALCCCAVLNALSMRVRPVRWGLAQGLSSESALETSGLVSLGMRRLAADLGLVRMLIYYGGPEGGPEDEEAQLHARYDPDHPELAWGGGRYSGLGTRALRILDADPSFSYAALFAAGALAFNLNRPDDSLRVLDYALSRDPHNLQFQAYVAAVGFHRHGDAQGVINRLEPVLGAADCPVMIKHMVAYLYVKAGQRQKAMALYRQIRDTSKDAGYRRMAEAALERLGMKSAILSAAHG
jgi:tetratricopeptide (TPR) repeat protein